MATAAHVAAFVPHDGAPTQVAEQAPGAPDAVWGLTEKSLTEAVDALDTRPATEPVEEQKTLTPTQSEELTAVAPAELAVVQAPEAVETVEKKAQRKPIEEPARKEAEPKKKPRPSMASGAPVGRAAGADKKPSSSSGGASFSNYAGRVAAHLRRYKRYPTSAGKATGTVRIAFSVNSGGVLQGVRLAGSSGNAVLDHAALDMVRRANPFPAIPPRLNRSSASFAVPVRFSP